MIVQKKRKRTIFAEIFFAEENKKETTMRNVRYNVQEQIEDGSEVRLIYCAASSYDDSWHSIMHRHPHAELFFCLEGKGELQIARDRFPLSRGDFFLINPGVEHTEHSSQKEPLSYVVIGASGVRFISEKEMDSQQRCSLIQGNSSEFEPYFLDIISELSQKKEGYLSICLSILNILLTKISRSMQIEIASSTPMLGALNCEEIKQLIDERFAQPITLEWLAAQAHISKYHLSHSFRRQYAISPIQYLNKRRLQEAEHLLAHTTHSLSEIGNMIGFSSASYFSQAFKNHTGMSPSEYRSNQKSKVMTGR